jgi:hypothetical protein
MLDNSTLVAQFVPKVEDGDTFIYTEMLDRGKKKGNNGQRLLKTFYHRSQGEFWEQWPTMQKLADMAQVRLCTRLAPKSYKKVGKEFVRLVVETGLTENWAGMKSLYNRACGISSPIQKLWLFDVDYPDFESEAFGCYLDDKRLLMESIPSKKGVHYISKPFNLLEWDPLEGGKLPANISLHKDNPTNLYIPDGAD